VLQKASNADGDVEWGTPAGGGDLLASANLSDLANVATARTNLGLAIGTNVQAYSANLTSFAGVAPTAAGLALLDDATADAQLTTLGATTAGANMLKAADSAAQRTLLSLVVGTDVAAFAATVTQAEAEAGALTTVKAWTPERVKQAIQALAITDLGAMAFWDAAGDLAVGTGANTAARLARGTDGQFLKSTATGIEWAAIPGGGDMLASNNLSDLASASTARTNLGVAIGTDVQAFDADLSALAALVSAANKLPYATGAGTWSLADFTAAARTVLDDATVADMVNTLGGATSTGTGGLARATSPTFVTPVLGTPTSGTLTNCTGLPVSTGISGLGSGVATLLATPTSANLLAALTTKTGTGLAVFDTSPTINSPTFSGEVNSSGAQVITASAMGANSVDVTKGRNTKSISTDTTLTFSGTATTGALFGLHITNTDTADHVITIPSSFSINAQAAITTFTLPAGGRAFIQWLYDGTTYHIFGETDVAGQAGAETDIASATATDLDSVNSVNVRITGTTQINGFGAAGAGVYRRIRFAGALTLQHNATSMILPSGANIVTAAGDRCGALSLGSSNWLITYYQRADGTALVGGAGGGDASTNTASSVDSEIALFSGTAGKTLKRATGTGIVKISSGVMSTAVAGTDYQAADAELAAIAGLTSAANKLPYFTGSGTAALTDFTAGGRALVNSAGTSGTFPYFSAADTVTLGTITAAGRAILDDADAAAQRATLSAAAIAQDFGWHGCFNDTGADETVVLVQYASFAGTITNAITDCDSGTATYTFKINGTNLGGTANAVSTTEQNQAHASANTFAVGDTISVARSANSTCTKGRFSLIGTRNLA
jgi:hypothetical protein